MYLKTCWDRFASSLYSHFPLKKCRRKEAYIVKTSKYNIFVDTDDGDILAFNSMTRALVKFDRNTYQTFQNAAVEVGGKKVDETDPLMAAFIKGGFLIPDHVDELEIIKVKEARGRYSVSNSLGLTIAPTTACNFNCAYCFENDKKPEFMSREIEDKIIEYVDNYMQPKGSLGITWYGGEPLLAIDTIYRLSDAFIKIVSEKQLNYTATLVTNGYLLNRETALELAKRKMTLAQITLDGDEGQHDKRRTLKNGDRTYHRIMSNMTEVADILPLTIRCNVDKSNADSFPKLLDEIDRYGLTKKVTMGPSALEAFDFSPQEIKDRTLSNSEFTDIYYEYVNMMMDRGMEVSLLPGFKKVFCVAVTEYTFVIDPRGRLYKCWNAIGMENEVIGMIDKKIKLEEGSAKWLSWDCFRYEKCRSCNMLPLCLGCCPRLKLIKDEITNNRDHCPPYKHDIPGFIKLLYRQGKSGRNIGRNDWASMAIH
jgi:radical SAM additional 4Fe4S-binding domain